MTESEKEPIKISLSVDPEVARQAYTELVGALEDWQKDPETAKKTAIIAIKTMQESNATPPEERVRDHLEISFDGSAEPEDRARQLVESMAPIFEPEEE
jgi:hypothetical protein